MNDRRNSSWWDEEDFYVPAVDGFGSMHDLSSDPGGKVFGEEGARIRVRLKRRPIGFHLPPPVRR